jgi:hypothetical protein
MTIQEQILKAEQKGIWNGSVTLIIVNGVIERAEYYVRDWKDDQRSVDSVVKPR